MSSQSQSHPDADAFVSAILRNPADVTTRLVFADWLEETGTPSNIAWAHFIRLNAEAAQYARGNPKREALEFDAAAYWWQINAKLTLSGKRFLSAWESLLQILPPWALTLRLGTCDVSLSVIELMPESVAHERLIFPLALHENLLLIVSADPGDCNTMQLVQYLLNKQIIAVRGVQDDILDAINRHYGPYEPLPDFTPIDTPLP
jgi:uncharacterized protein (TIGR02996 family)